MRWIPTFLHFPFPILAPVNHLCLQPSSPLKHWTSSPRDYLAASFKVLDLCFFFFCLLHSNIPGEFPPQSPLSDFHMYLLREFHASSTFTVPFTYKLTHIPFLTSFCFHQDLRPLKSFLHLCPRSYPFSLSLDTGSTLHQLLTQLSTFNYPPLLTLLQPRDQLTSFKNKTHFIY